MVFRLLRRRSPRGVFQLDQGDIGVFLFAAVLAKRFRLRVAQLQFLIRATGDDIAI